MNFCTNLLTKLQNEKTPQIFSKEIKTLQAISLSETKIGSSRAADLREVSTTTSASERENGRNGVKKNNHNGSLHLTPLWDQTTRKPLRKIPTIHHSFPNTCHLKIFFFDEKWEALSEENLENCELRK